MLQLLSFAAVGEDVGIEKEKKKPLGSFIDLIDYGV